jgi:hypothetical protein
MTYLTPMVDLSATMANVRRVANSYGVKASKDLTHADATVAALAEIVDTADVPLPALPLKDAAAAVDAYAESAVKHDARKAAAASLLPSARAHVADALRAMAFDVVQVLGDRFAENWATFVGTQSVHGLSAADLPRQSAETFALYQQAQQSAFALNRLLSDREAIASDVGETAVVPDARNLGVLPVLAAKMSPFKDQSSFTPTMHALQAAAAEADALGRWAALLQLERTGVLVVGLADRPGVNLAAFNDWSNAYWTGRQVVHNYV